MTFVYQFIKKFENLLEIENTRSSSYPYIYWLLGEIQLTM